MVTGRLVFRRRKTSKARDQTFLEGRPPPVTGTGLGQGRLRQSPAPGLEEV